MAGKIKNIKNPSSLEKYGFADNCLALITRLLSQPGITNLTETNIISYVNEELNNTDITSLNRNQLENYIGQVLDACNTLLRGNKAKNGDPKKVVGIAKYLRTYSSNKDLYESDYNAFLGTNPKFAKSSATIIKGYQKAINQLVNEYENYVASGKAINQDKFVKLFSKSVSLLLNMQNDNDILKQKCNKVIGIIKEYRAANRAYRKFIAEQKKQNLEEGKTLELKVASFTRKEYLVVRKDIQSMAKMNNNLDQILSKITKTINKPVIFNTTRRTEKQRNEQVKAAIVGLEREIDNEMKAINSYKNSALKSFVNFYTSDLEDKSATQIALAAHALPLWKKCNLAQDLGASLVYLKSFLGDMNNAVDMQNIVTQDDNLLITNMLNGYNAIKGHSSNKSATNQNREMRQRYAQVMKSVISVIYQPEFVDYKATIDHIMQVFDNAEVDENGNKIFNERYREVIEHIEPLNSYYKYVTEQLGNIKNKITNENLEIILKNIEEKTSPFLNNGLNNALSTYEKYAELKYFVKKEVESVEFDKKTINNALRARPDIVGLVYAAVDYIKENGEIYVNVVKKYNDNYKKIIKMPYSKNSTTNMKNLYEMDNLINAAINEINAIGNNPKYNNPYDAVNNKIQEILVDGNLTDKQKTICNYVLESVVLNRLTDNTKNIGEEKNKYISNLSQMRDIITNIRQSYDNYDANYRDIPLAMSNVNFAISGGGKANVKLHEDWNTHIAILKGINEKIEEILVKSCVLRINDINNNKNGDDAFNNLVSSHNEYMEIAEQHKKALYVIINEKDADKRAELIKECLYGDNSLAKNIDNSFTAVYANYNNYVDVLKDDKKQNTTDADTKVNDETIEDDKAKETNVKEDNSVEEKVKADETNAVVSPNPIPEDTIEEEKVKKDASEEEKESKAIKCKLEYEDETGYHNIKVEVEDLEEWKKENPDKLDKVKRIEILEGDLNEHSFDDFQNVDNLIFNKFPGNVLDKTKRSVYVSIRVSGGYIHTNGKGLVVLNNYIYPEKVKEENNPIECYISYKEGDKEQEIPVYDLEEWQKENPDKLDKVTKIHVRDGSLKEDSFNNFTNIKEITFDTKLEELPDKIFEKIEDSVKVKVVFGRNRTTETTVKGVKTIIKLKNKEEIIEEEKESKAIKCKLEYKDGAGYHNINVEVEDLEEWKKENPDKLDKVKTIEILEGDLNEHSFDDFQNVDYLIFNKFPGNVLVKTNRYIYVTIRMNDNYINTNGKGLILLNNYIYPEKVKEENNPIECYIIYKEGDKEHNIAVYDLEEWKKENPDILPKIKKIELKSKFEEISDKAFEKIEDSVEVEMFGSGMLLITTVKCVKTIIKLKNKEEIIEDETIEDDKAKETKVKAVVKDGKVKADETNAVVSPNPTTETIVEEFIEEDVKGALKCKLVYEEDDKKYILQVNDLAKWVSEQDKSENNMLNKVIGVVVEEGNLTEHSFDNLPNVEFVTLEEDIKEIPENTFKGMNNIKIIQIQQNIVEEDEEGNRAFTINDGSFNGLKSTTNITFGGNNGKYYSSNVEGVKAFYNKSIPSRTTVSSTVEASDINVADDSEEIKEVSGSTSKAETLVLEKASIDILPKSKVKRFLHRIARHPVTTALAVAAGLTIGIGLLAIFGVPFAVAATTFIAKSYISIATVTVLSSLGIFAAKCVARLTIKPYRVMFIEAKQQKIIDEMYRRGEVLNVNQTKAWAAQQEQIKIVEEIAENGENKERLARLKNKSRVYKKCNNKMDSVIKDKSHGKNKKLAVSVLEEKFNALQAKKDKIYEKSPRRSEDTDETKASIEGIKDYLTTLRKNKDNLGEAIAEKYNKNAKGKSIDKVREFVETSKNENETTANNLTDVEVKDENSPLSGIVFENNTLPRSK